MSHKMALEQSLAAAAASQKHGHLPGGGINPALNPALNPAMALQQSMAGANHKLALQVGFISFCNITTDIFIVFT